jgi:hypothetical protein
LEKGKELTMREHDVNLLRVYLRGDPRSSVLVSGNVDQLIKDRMEDAGETYAEARSSLVSEFEAEEARLRTEKVRRVQAYSREYAVDAQQAKRKVEANDPKMRGYATTRLFELNNVITELRRGGATVQAVIEALRNQFPHLCRKASEEKIGDLALAKICNYSNWGAAEQLEAEQAIMLRHPELAACYEDGSAVSVAALRTMFPQLIK